MSKKKPQPPAKKLKADHKRFIIGSLALWQTHETVRAAVKDTFDIEISKQAVTYYAVEYKDEILAERERLKSDLKTIPIANALYRMNEYYQLYADIKENLWTINLKSGEYKGHHLAAIKCLEAAREEMAFVTGVAGGGDGGSLEHFLKTLFEQGERQPALIQNFIAMGPDAFKMDARVLNQALVMQGKPKPKPKPKKKEVKGGRKKTKPKRSV